MTEFMSQFLDGYTNSLQEAKEFVFSERVGELVLNGLKYSVIAGWKSYRLKGTFDTIGEAGKYANKRWLKQLLEQKFGATEDIAGIPQKTQKITAAEKAADARRISAQGGRIPGWLGGNKLGSQINKISQKIARKDLFDSAGVIKHSGKAAKGLSIIGSAISIGFGIFDTINGAKKIREGSTLSEEFRKIIGPLDKEKDRIIEFWSLSSNIP